MHSCSPLLCTAVLASIAVVCRPMSTNGRSCVAQGDRAQGAGTQGDRAHSNYKATTSARDESECGAWQSPAYRAGPSKSSPRPNSNRGPPAEADTYPHSVQSISALADTAARPGTAAPRLDSQQGSLQGSDKDRADSHQWPRSFRGSHRLDPRARGMADWDLAARDYGEPPAGLSNSRRPEQHEHQDKLQRPSAEHGTSKGLQSGKGFSDTVPAARPYATEQSLKVASWLDKTPCTMQGHQR